MNNQTCLCGHLLWGGVGGGGGGGVTSIFFSSHMFGILY